MIRMRTDLFSQALGMGTSVVVLMPQVAAGVGMTGAADPAGASRRGVPVLYLLHGLSDDCTVWERRTAIERYASELGIAVVMPEVRRSFYADEVLGEKYWTYISEELPRLLAGTLNISTAREDTFVAGLSMGGYGAVKLALRHPERYAAAASLSGVLDLAPFVRAWFESPDRRHLAERIWGASDAPIDLTGTDDDLLHLLRTADPAALPQLWIDCGTEDSLIEGNRAFIALAEERGAPLTASLRPGAHTWDFWDEGIQNVLAWLPRRG